MFVLFVFCVQSFYVVSAPEGDGRYMSVRPSVPPSVELCDGSDELCDGSDEL
jgi:hypothetical protein